MPYNQGKVSASLVCAAILAWQNANLIKEIAASGRVLELAASPSDRVLPPRAITPGIAPILTFRYLEGSERHRFTGLNLVIDDAGH
jgi:hypothetical protein